jgi:cardiolipin synthase
MPDSEIPSKPRRRRLILLFVIVMHIAGALTSVQAVMSTRTSQGAIAWAVSLNACPYVAVPAYWVFGRSKFDGYAMIEHKGFMEDSEALERARRILEDEGMLFEPTTADEKSHVKLLENLARLPITRQNSAELLIDGKATFDAIIEGISEARDYVLVEFYIIRDDGLGQRLKAALVERANAGVRVYVLYDELGSKDLPSSYTNELRDAGAEVHPFNTTQGAGNRFRLNFRNHRKIVVIDGEVAYVGGLNVGDEYLGLGDPKLSPWRDTHVGMRGPVVQCVQVPFVEDWNWATGTTLSLNWKPQKAPEGNALALCLPTGPADVLEHGTLWFLHAINSAQNRLWIVSPYFVPDEQLMSALQLAALRGVDVRILIPENPDQQLVYLSSFSYLEEAEAAGIQIYRYKPGFLHQKVALIDDRWAVVGTANLDNRSMRLNFEITMLFEDKEFAREVESMLEDDFSRSRLVSASEYTGRSLLFRLSVRVARLMAPVQ